MEPLADIVASILVPGKLVWKVLAAVVGLANAERGVVLVVGEDGTLKAGAWAGGNTADLSAVVRLCRGYLGELRKATRAVVIPDTRKDDRFRKMPGLKASDILSFACVPLRVEGSLYGILYLDHTVFARLFSSLELERIERYAKLITSAMARDEKLPQIDGKVATVSINDYLAERTIDEIERQQVSALLRKHNWHIERTSQAMGLPRRTLYNKMMKYGIRRPRPGKAVAAGA